MTLASTAVELLVPFHDVDALRVVWHGHYYKYMEVARTQLLRERGIDGPELHAMGYALYVIETKCRHVFPLRYGDRFRVDARVLDADNRVNLAYEIHNLSQDRRSAKGTTTLVTTDLAGNLQYATPEAIRSRLGA